MVTANLCGRGAQKSRGVSPPGGPPPPVPRRVPRQLVLRAYTNAHASALLLAIARFSAQSLGTTFQKRF